jgi:hypothetical protein
MCTSTCGPSPSSTGYGRAAARRTCVAGRCTPPGSRHTTSTPRTTPSRRVVGGPGCRGGPGLRVAVRPARCREPCREGGTGAARRLARRGPGAPRALPGWASVPIGEVDPVELDGLLALDRFVGLQMPATELLTPAAWERAGDALGLLERVGKPLFVHPGRSPRSQSPVSCPAGGRRSSGTSPRCRPPGGAGTPRVAGRCSLACGSCSRAGAGLRRCTTSGTSPREVGH